MNTACSDITRRIGYLRKGVLTAFVVVLGTALIATCPWGNDDRVWFEISALLEALLLAAFLLTIV